MSQERRYIPQIGSRVRMRLFSDYTNLGLPPWTVLHCIGLEGVGDNTVVCQRSLTANGEHDGEIVRVPLSSLDPPCGWQPRYTIHVQPEKVQDVLGWLARGITIRQSQYIGDGSTAFQPMDNSGQPHWKYGEVTDVIPPEDTKDLIRIVMLETEWDAGIPAPCRYCDGTGTHTTNESLEAQTESTATCEFCGVHLGFSFRESWHSHSNNYGRADQGQCKHVYPAGACWVCGGNGKGKQCISSIPAGKERKQAIAQLEAQGWKVWYQKRGQVWMMERETVVKEWGMNAKGGK